MVKHSSDTVKDVLKEANAVFNDANTLVKRAVGTPVVKSLFKYGSMLITATSDFYEKPTPLNAVKQVFNIGKALSEDNIAFGLTYFEDNDWSSAIHTAFNEIVVDAMTGMDRIIMRPSETSTLNLIKLSPTCQIGWVATRKSGGGAYVDIIYTDNRSECDEILPRLIRQKHMNQPLIIKKTSNAYNERSVTVERDETCNPMPSALADKMVSYLKRCFAVNVSRSIMFYGPPGTGKSTVARTIVENLGMNYIRVRSEDIDTWDNTLITRALEIFTPDVIIFDDFDRCGSQVHLLEMLEMFHRDVKLVIATVNDRSSLDKAILRPGRFDELIEVKKMDDAVIMKMLGDFGDGFELVKEWPIAFINEYVKRRTFMTHEETALACKELAQRVDEILNAHEGVDDQMAHVTRTLKLLKMNSKKKA